MELAARKYILLRKFTFRKKQARNKIRNRIFALQKIVKARKNGMVLCGKTRA